MGKIMMITILYFIGLLVFLVTGLCTFNWLYMVALLIGIIGLGYSVYRKYN